MTVDYSPQSEEELADIIKGAVVDRDTLRVKGGGSRLALGRYIEAAGTVVTTGMAGIEQYNPGALSLVVKAGTPLTQLNQVLAEAGQRLAFEPMDHRAMFSTEGTEPTIGGVVACGISGPRRIRVGACRDALIGVRFVNGKGEIIKNGGQVMKNVTGYDLVKFMCGSYGTLGVLTELSFKTSPLPETEATFVITGLDDLAANKFMSDALKLPLDISAAAHVPLDEPKTYLRVEGITGFVKTRLNALKDLSGQQNEKAHCHELSGQESEDVWAGIRDILPFAKTTGDIWKISVKPTDGPLYIESLKKHISVQHFYDWAGGLIWLLTTGNTVEDERVIRQVLKAYGGHGTLVRASDEAREAVSVFQPEPPVLAGLASRVREQFDPDNILNPGLL